MLLAPQYNFSRNHLRNMANKTLPEYFALKRMNEKKIANLKLV